MRTLMVCLVVCSVIGVASSQLATRWYRLYGAENYETVLKDLQYSAGVLYGLTSLYQPTGDDAISLVRYTLGGALVDVRPYGFANGAQEDAFGVVPLPNGESLVVCALSEPAWGSNGPLPERTTIVYYPAGGYALAERRALGVPAALTFNGETLYIGFNTHLRQFGYHAVDPSTLTVQTTTITGSDGYLLGIAWSPASGVVLNGWNGSATGRKGFYWQSDTFTFLDDPFGFVLHALPLESQLVYSWGSADEAAACMFGPAGIEGDKVLLKSGGNFLYALALSDSGNALLIRLNTETLAREWETPLQDLYLTDWSIDAAGNVYLLRLGTLIKVRADGTITWQAPVPVPEELVREGWWVAFSRLALVDSGRFAIGGVANDFTESHRMRHAFVLLVALAGDTNGDGCVDDTDLVNVLFAFGSDEPNADLNDDGIVDDADLLEVLFNFGNC